MTPERPSCIHGKPLSMTPDDQCQPCIDLIAEETGRQVWIDGLVRLTAFLQKHPDFIPSYGAIIHNRVHGEVADQRTAVFDLIEGAGPVVRRDYFQDESHVNSQAFGPHEFGLTVKNEAIGKNVTKPTAVWDWDDSIFGAGE